MTFEEWVATSYRLLPEGSDALRECWEDAYAQGYYTGYDDGREFARVEDDDH